MPKKRVAINGFGRIGRAIARLILTDYKDKFDLIAINDPSPIDLTAHLFQFDSNFGTFKEPIEISDQNLVINGKKIQCFSTRSIKELPWEKNNIDIVFECTGVFRTAEACQKHVTQGAKKVLLSAPCKSEGFKTIVLGVNDEELTPNDTLISNASCTTNCLAPVVKVLDENFDVKMGTMTTIHSYTNDQNVLDVGHKDFRRARAAGLSMIPTTTGAAKAVGIVYPKIKGLLLGGAIRVPTPTVSIVDLTVKVGKKCTVESVNTAFEKAAKKIPHILGYETRPLVSKDFQGDSRSSILDADQTVVVGDMVKVLAWYDNEWGYSCRLVELALKV